MYISLRNPAVVAFVPDSFILGQHQVPLPDYQSPECRALMSSRAYRLGRLDGKTYRWAMVDAVVAALRFHNRLRCCPSFPQPFG